MRREDLKVGMQVTKNDLVDIVGVYVVFDKDYTWADGGTIKFIGESIPEDLKEQMLSEGYANFFYQTDKKYRAYSDDVKKALAIGNEVTLEDLNSIRGIEGLFIYLEMLDSDRGVICYVDVDLMPRFYQGGKKLFFL